MKCLKRYEGRTATLGFSLKLYEAPDADGLVAKLDSHSPPRTRKETAQSILVTRYNDPEEIRHKDQNGLIELCKKRIKELGGSIMQFNEVSD